MAILKIGTQTVTPVIKETVAAVPSYIPKKTIVNGVYGPDTTQTTFSISPATSVAAHGLESAFAGNTNLISADFGSLTTISTANALYSCFQGSTQLTTVDFSNLTTISNSTAMNSCFSGCIRLATISFPALTTITQQLSSGYNAVFYGCTRLSSVSFGALTSTTFATKTNQLQYIFTANVGSQVTGGCTVHFPSNFDPDSPTKTFDITTLDGYPTFGGGASYIHLVYDLPATE